MLRAQPISLRQLTILSAKTWLSLRSTSTLIKLLAVPGTLSMRMSSSPHARTASSDCTTRAVEMTMANLKRPSRVTPRRSTTWYTVPVYLESLPQEVTTKLSASGVRMATLNPCRFVAEMVLKIVTRGMCELSPSSLTSLLLFCQELGMRRLRCGTFAMESIFGL